MTPPYIPKPVYCPFKTQYGNYCVHRGNRDSRKGKKSNWGHTPVICSNNPASCKYLNETQKSSAKRLQSNAEPTIITKSIEFIRNRLK